MEPARSPPPRSRTRVFPSCPFHATRSRRGAHHHGYRYPDHHCFVREEFRCLFGLDRPWSGGCRFHRRPFPACPDKGLRMAASSLRPAEHRVSVPFGDERNSKRRRDRNGPWIRKRICQRPRHRFRLRCLRSVRGARRYRICPHRGELCDDDALHGEAGRPIRDGFCRAERRYRTWRAHRHRGLRQPRRCLGLDPDDRIGPPLRFKRRVLHGLFPCGYRTSSRSRIQLQKSPDSSPRKKRPYRPEASQSFSQRSASFLPSVASRKFAKEESF